ncbi:CFI-box-CTERM domain-containing protein [Hyalangium rubrum]|uniref:CFI-box-CTERM domain-containing protein n=1 Tax=Hyalangium rubrum TaxID=3103134 RepID=A0ABU5H5M8_9BACT|nr:CFI-box-CTERM domain-containing protein [Hyalangium sp. s54d21]MDY7228785.1 CFI-box-CTERM domain-containing protein [Hyalangium sp. s54d21]
MCAALQPEELFQAAQERAAQIDVRRSGLPAALERVRADASALFARIPEPPLYRRAEDPARKAAEALLPEVERVLAMALAVSYEREAPAAIHGILAAVRAHGEALCHTVSGRLGQAESAWRRALELERAAHPTRNLVTQAPRQPPVFDKSSGASRYDPREAPHAKVKLVCPNTGCKRIDDYAFTASHAYHRFVCPACNTPFLAYFGELRMLEVESHRSSNRYLFTVDEIAGGGSSRIDFEEASGAEFPAARRDLLAFLYTEARELKAVVNVTNGRLMWISPAASCFLATAAFGEGAPELVAFRAFRDDVLRHHGLGRAFIRGYYRHGPGVAEWVVRHPRVRTGVRGALTLVHRGLIRSGHA